MGFVYWPDLIQGVKDEIMLFGSSCFVVGVLYAVAFFAKLTSRRFMRTSQFGLAAFYTSTFLATVLVSIYKNTQGRHLENDVFVLLLVVALAIAWLLFLIFSKRSPSELLVLLAGESAITTETVLVQAPTLEDCCQELQNAYGLTAREGEVLLHLARGKTAAAIAEILYITRDTVSTHTQHIYQKTMVGSQDQLIELVDSLK
jgi:DNA-binding CsgD family transcriptional regulator